MKAYCLFERSTIMKLMRSQFRKLYIFCCYCPRFRLLAYINFLCMIYTASIVFDKTASLIIFLLTHCFTYSVDVGVTEISNYLSLGACMDGLRLLTERLYGITLRHVTPEPGECWHNTVHKIQVMSTIILQSCAHSTISRKSCCFTGRIKT